ncbi:MAG: aminotransferase class I/II-fold pyridoxal phosphate-dependent enzyme, partial [Pseudomonadota bacterium]
PSLSQAAGVASFDCTQELSAHLETYLTNRSLLLEALPQLGITETAPPDGAFYIYGRVDPFTDDSRRLCLELLKDTGVATTSGVDFDTVDGRRFLRMSFAVSTAQVQDAIERMTPWFRARG